MNDLLKTYFSLALGCHKQDKFENQEQIQVQQALLLIGEQCSVYNSELFAAIFKSIIKLKILDENIFSCL